MVVNDKFIPFGYSTGDVETRMSKSVAAVKKEIRTKRLTGLVCLAVYKKHPQRVEVERGNGLDVLQVDNCWGQPS